MVSITRNFEFSASHHLPEHKGLCNNLHGHNYLLQVTITGPVQKKTEEMGMIMDFTTLKNIVQKTILHKLDHQDLNEIWDNPTAENMVETIAWWLGTALKNKAKLLRVKLWETSNSYAEWEANK